MTSRAVSSFLRRSVVPAGTNTLRGGRSPPLPPFQRLPVPSQKLSEQNDVVWDDSVAPELAFDFESQHISTAEAAITLSGFFAVIGAFYQFIKWTDPPSMNPAKSRTEDMVCDCFGAPLNGKEYKVQVD